MDPLPMEATPASNNTIKIITLGVSAILALALLLLGIFYFLNRGPVAITPADSPQDATYQINGKLVRLSGGVSGALFGKTELVGTSVTGDVNGDAVQDAAVYLRQTKSSGTYLYMAAALKTDQGYMGTAAIPLAANAQPGELQIIDGVLTASYLLPAASNASSTETRTEHAFAVIKEGGLVQRSPEQALPLLTPPQPVFLQSTINTKASQPNLGVAITVTGVDKDSRCPADVACIQAGTLVLHADVTLASSTPQSVSFELGKPVPVDGFGSITLADVAPATLSNTTINPKNYSFTFALIKN